jgi:hypothetical protein
MKRVILLLGLVAVVGAVSCGGEERLVLPATDEVACGRDSDCVVSCLRLREDCCSSCLCRNVYHRDTLARIEAWQARNCGPDSCKIRVDCPTPRSRTEARCQERRCRAVELPLEGGPGATPADPTPPTPPTPAGPAPAAPAPAPTPP